MCLKVVMLGRRLLQRGHKPHHIVDVPLALRALPPLSQVQLTANRAILIGDRFAEKSMADAGHAGQRTQISVQPEHAVTPTGMSAPWGTSGISAERSLMTLFASAWTLARRPNSADRHDLAGQFDEIQDQWGPGNCAHRYHLSEIRALTIGRGCVVCLTSPPVGEPDPGR